MSHPDCRVGFILSPSRTGTVFLAHALRERFPDAVWVHEPWPARAEVMLGNLRNDWGVGGRLLGWLFRYLRSHRFQSAGKSADSGRYIEINPMLCPITDLLPTLDIPLHVVHLVRDPRTWVRSILAFKASGYRRYLIDYIPFATPYPSPRPAGWNRLTPPERALWRWTHCNRRILNIKSQCARYRLVRYEDLFSPTADVRHTALAALLETLGLPEPSDLSWFQTQERKNPAPASPYKHLELDETAVTTICGDLLDEFGYCEPTGRN